MITFGTAISEVRKLINVTPVKEMVATIYYDEVKLSELDRAMAAKEKFIVVNCLEHDFDQMQSGTVNVNIYCPDINGGRDLTGLDAILTAVKPLLEDATTNVLSTELGRPTLAREPDKPYSFYNQRVNVFADNLNQYQNIKLN